MQGRQQLLARKPAIRDDADEKGETSAPIAVAP